MQNLKDNKESIPLFILICQIFISGTLIWIGILSLPTDDFGTAINGFLLLIAGILMLCLTLFQSIQSSEFRVLLAERMDRNHRFIPKKSFSLDEDEIINLAPNYDFIYSAKNHQGVIRHLTNEGAEYYILYTRQTLDSMKEDEPLSFGVLIKKGLNTEGFSLFRKISSWKKLCRVYEKNYPKREDLLESSQNADRTSNLISETEIKKPITHARQLQSMLLEGILPDSCRKAVRECLNVTQDLKDETLKKRCESLYFPEFIEMLKICGPDTEPVLIQRITDSIQTFTEQLKIKEKNQLEQKKKESLEVQLTVLESMMKMDGLIEDEFQKQIHRKRPKS